MDGNTAENVSCFMALRACALRVTFVIVIGLGLFVSALVVCLEVYGLKVIDQSQGDTIIKEISSKYCKGVQISVADNTSNFNSFVMPGNPSFSSKKMVYLNGKQFYIPSWSYQYWHVYLLKGSVINMHICADQYLMFYVIKGLKSFNEWQQTTLYRGYHQTHRLFPKKNCKEHSQFDRFVIEANETDTFFILLSSSVGWRFYTRASIMLKFTRNIYNTTNAMYSCTSQDANGTCYLPLIQDSANIIVIEHTPLGGETPDIFKPSRLKWKPDPRLTYYAQFFGGIFLCVVSLTILYSVLRCVTKLRKKSDDYPPLKSGTISKEKPHRKVALPRRPTRTTLSSYEFVNQSEVLEEEEAGERRLSRLNEEFNASSTYTSTDQVRDLSMTAAGISAI